MAKEAAASKPKAPRKSAKADAKASSPTGRLLAVLDLASQLGMVSAADLIFQLDLPRPTAHRLIASLEELKLLQKMPLRGKFAVAPRMVKLATGILKSSVVYAPVQTLLTGLAQKTGETCSVAMVSSGEVEYIASVIGHSPLTLQFQAGQKAPMHATSSGCVFLASLEDAELDRFLATGPWDSPVDGRPLQVKELEERVRAVRKNGYALNDSGYIAGVVGAAVPIADAEGNVNSVLTLSAPRSRKTMEDIKAIVPLMKNYAGRIARTL